MQSHSSSDFDDSSEDNKTRCLKMGAVRLLNAKWGSLNPKLNIQHV